MSSTRRFVEILSQYDKFFKKAKFLVKKGKVTQMGVIARRNLVSELSRTLKAKDYYKRLLEDWGNGEIFLLTYTFQDETKGYEYLTNISEDDIPLYIQSQVNRYSEKNEKVTISYKRILTRILI